MKSRKAKDFFDIQDAVAFNNPIDNNDPFYTDFSDLRKQFSEKKLYRYLNMSQDGDCKPLKTSQKIFLRGHRGTGKTSELKTLANRIEDTKCYFVVFTDLSGGELDINNIDIIDVLILLLENLVTKLEKSGAQIDDDYLESFYNWYNERIVEINNKVDASAQIEMDTETGISIPLFSTLLIKTKSKLLASNETKETIRRVFSNKFSDFSIKFNEFILALRDQLRGKGKYDDLLFIVDGFEKIGSLQNRKKVIIDDSNRFNEIATNMIITLPIELFADSSILESFAKIIPFPLIELNDKAKEKFKEFILKRVDISLFENEDVIEKIIIFGAGSPRETLRIIKEAYFEADDNIIDMSSVSNVIKNMSQQMEKYLESKEIKLLRDIYNKKHIPFSEIKANLLVEKVLLEYADDTKINPIIMENEKFKRLME